MARPVPGLTPVAGVCETTSYNGMYIQRRLGAGGQFINDGYRAMASDYDTGNLAVAGRYGYINGAGQVALPDSLGTVAHDWYGMRFLPGWLDGQYAVCDIIALAIVFGGSDGHRGSSSSSGDVGAFQRRSTMPWIQIDGSATQKNGDLEQWLRQVQHVQDESRRLSAVMVQISANGTDWVKLGAALGLSAADAQAVYALFNAARVRLNRADVDAILAQLG